MPKDRLGEKGKQEENTLTGTSFQYQRVDWHCRWARHSKTNHGEKTEAEQVNVRDCSKMDCTHIALWVLNSLFTTDCIHLFTHVFIHWWQVLPHRLPTHPSEAPGYLAQGHIDKRATNQTTGLLIINMRDRCFIIRKELCMCLFVCWGVFFTASWVGCTSVHVCGLGGSSSSVISLNFWFSCRKLNEWF